MKDFITRTLVILISWSFIAYLAFLFQQGAVIVTSSDPMINILGYAALIAIILFISIVFGVYPFHFPRTKRITTVIGLLFIIAGTYEFINDTTKMIFVSDLMRVFGVILAITGPIGILISDKIKKLIQQKKTHIIEI